MISTQTGEGEKPAAGSKEEALLGEKLQKPSKCTRRKL
jgi:hypothetical protein